MFTEKLEDGKTLEVEQTESDTYIAQIRGMDGLIESATTQPTMNDVWKWLVVEHGHLDPISKTMYKQAETAYEEGLLPE